MKLRTATLVIRDTEYVVSEMTGRQMQKVRFFLTSPETQTRIEAFVSWQCVKINDQPAFENEGAASEAPQALIAKLSSTAFELTKDEATEGVKH